MPEFTGWPIKCPECESWDFNFATERSGESRRYSCKKCKVVYIAIWRGKPFGSCLSEPKNTKMQDWTWLKVQEES